MPTSSARLNYLLKESFDRQDIHGAIDAFKEYQISHCYNPQNIRIFDSHLGKFRIKQVPCGKCYHCRETRINEWVTRMYAHCEDYKYVYFITLTYRSFSDTTNSVNQLMLDKLAQAFWHKDSFNETKHLSYSPCLLCKDHYQKFLKRLRKYSGISNIGVCVSGEYGKKFGRPHFHLILFSNEPLSYQIVKRAWSVALFKHNEKGWMYKTSQKHNGTPYYFPIGRVDFHDLVSNGSFNTADKIKVDGQFMNATNCFAYVCKYVCKGGKYNRSRIDLAYNSLFEKEIVTENCVHPYQFSQVWNYLSSTGVKILNINQSNLSITYEKIKTKMSQDFYFFGLQYVKTFKFPTMSLEKPLFPKDQIDFREQYSTFVEFSRGVPIGSIYAKTHIHEFKEGVFNKPLLQTTSFVVPRYFLSKAQEYVYGLRTVRKTSAGSSYSLSNLPNLHRFFRSCTEAVPLQYTISYDTSDTDVVSRLVSSNHSFLDKYSGEHIIFPCTDGVTRAEFYVYSRSDRKYILTRSMSFDAFVSHALYRLGVEFERYQKVLQQEKENRQNEESAADYLLQLGFVLDDLRIKFEDEQNQYLHHRDKLYDDIHKSAE